jgi:hypothetical protein
VLSGVLARKGEGRNDRKLAGFENFSVVVKARKSVLDFFQVIFCDDVTTNGVAEF